MAGLSHQELVGNRYGYNGNEVQPELSLMDFNARFYSPMLGRWFQPDPKAEFQYSFGQYNGIHNNPINLNDPNGDIAPAIWAAIMYAMETAAETGVDIALGITLSYLTGVPYTGWDIAADYFMNLVPFVGEGRSVKRVADIGIALNKSYKKFSNIPGSEKVFKEVQGGLEKFKKTGNIGVLDQLKGALYEFKLINSLDNVVRGQTNAYQLAALGGLTKDAGKRLNTKYGDVTFDLVQKNKDGSLNLIEAKTGNAFSRAKSFRGLSRGKLKAITGKIDMASEFNKAGGFATVEFRFSQSITPGLRQDIVNYALDKGVNVNIFFD